MAMAAWARIPFVCGLLGLSALQFSVGPGTAAELTADRAWARDQVVVPVSPGLSAPSSRSHVVSVESKVVLAAPNDPAYTDLMGELHVQWPAHALNLVEAWGYYPGWYFEASGRPQEAPIVAVIDTGVDSSHADFMNPGATSSAACDGGQLMLSAARSFLVGDPDQYQDGAVDEHGHGTHLAGLIAAGANNGVTEEGGVAGLGYPVRLLPIKVAGANGVAMNVDVAAAIVYAADQGALVILLGVACPTWSQVVQDAVDYAWERGCFLVAPAGVEPEEQHMFPAACPHVFGVGSVTSDLALAGYSPAGDEVALVGPGGDEMIGVYSTLPTYACTLRSQPVGADYGWLCGTSQAAAHVAAAAGLYAGLDAGSQSGERDGARIWQALQRSATAVEGATEGTWDEFRGYGLVSPSGVLKGEATEGAGGIVGRVLASGTAAVGATVTAYPEGGGTPVTAVARRPAAAYRLANVPTGTYLVRAETEDYRAEWEGVVVAGHCDVPGVDFRLADPPAGATLIAAEIPAAAVRGERLEVLVRLANTGDSSWQRADGYRLRQTACDNPLCVDPAEMDLEPGEIVAPGQSRTFVASLPVRDTCGFYETAWQMCQQGGAGRFGEVAVGTVSVTSFLDVPADHWALAAIEAAKAAGLVSGYDGHLYHPEWLVSRDQMAVYLARALAGGDALVPAGPAASTFEDVSPGHWAYKYVEYVHEREVAQGYLNGLYHPEYVLDRAQMAVFIARAMGGGEGGLEGYVPPARPSFSDVPPDSWAYKHVEYIKGSGVVAGYPDGLYHPEYECSRDQIAVYIANAFGME